jgi:hypothetical protein
MKDEENKGSGRQGREGGGRRRINKGKTKPRKKNIQEKENQYNDNMGHRSIRTIRCLPQS